MHNRQKYALVQTVPPGSEPVSVADAKAFCFVASDFTADDPFFTSEITAARERCERVSGLQLVSATWQLSQNHWPDSEPHNPFRDYERPTWLDEYGAIIIPKPPLISLGSIVMIDTTGTTQTLDSSTYQVDTISRPGRIRPAFGTIWPIARREWNAITITFTAGFATVPEEIKTRIKQCVAYCYENRFSRDEVFLDNLFTAFWHGWTF